MCKYILVSYLLCSCKYWMLSVPSSKTARTESGCPLFPYPTTEKADEEKEGRCEFCEEDDRETLAMGKGWFLR